MHTKIRHDPPGDVNTEPPSGDARDQDANSCQPAGAKRLALDRAVANVVELARRLNLSSVKGYGSPEESLEAATETDDNRKTGGDPARAPPARTSGGRLLPKHKPSATVRSVRMASRFRRTEPSHRTPRGVQCLTAHLPVPPPPPPPSPRCPQARELCLALEGAEALLAQYAQADAVLDQLLEQARAIDRQAVLQRRMQRDADMVRSLEAEFSGRSMLCLAEAIRADCESLQVRELRERCLRSLERHEQRLLALDRQEELQEEVQEVGRELGNGKGTQTDLYDYDQDALSKGPTAKEFYLPREREPWTDEAVRRGAGDSFQVQQKRAE
ncbi:uncharacterized protein LOC108092883 [Drosophila ficusphila]|uniref:uncharacterized protein LOC108092883 n=1 Tax=Drosophila ficusphila TaxID=30025 RepID=UPI0007E68641|nr:uncharacterized protein LOC108092883 [Drosophila ficusphila]